MSQSKSCCPSLPLTVPCVSGLVSLESAYHHGEDSLNKAITGMAQCFVGANNVTPSVPFNSTRAVDCTVVSPPRSH